MKKIKLILLILLCATSSSVFSVEYDVANLQKLFTDKNQRAEIDAERSGDSTTELQHAKKIEVSGYVTRSGGKSVVWVNDKNTLESSNLDGVRVKQSSIGKNKKVAIRVDGETVRLKPGETWLDGKGISDGTDR